MLSFNVICAVVLLFSNTFAYGSSGKEQNCIYVCVEETDSSESDGHDYRKDTKGDEYFMPYSCITKRGGLPPKHCFLAQGAENLSTPIPPKDCKQLRHIDSIDTIGLGANTTTILKVVSGEKVVAALYPEDHQLLKSPEYVKNYQVECEPIFCGKDLPEDYKEQYDGSIRRAMKHKWADVVYFMEKEETSHYYGLYNFNCCNATKSVAEKIGGNKTVIAKLNKVNWGIGTDGFEVPQDENL